MCGILGCVGVENAANVLYDGLERLEYRGYDSAGLAVGANATITVEKVAGRVDGLETDELPEASYGIAHTRWATHGPPTQHNAHPHLSCEGDIAIAHNGIIENHNELRADLEANGHTFQSDTDTETIAHLLEDLYEGDIGAALEEAAKRLDGTYAILATHVDEPETIAATRHRSPLVIGLDEGTTFIASDVVAFRAHTDEVIYLQDGDLALLDKDGYTLTSQTPRSIEPQRVSWKLEEATKAGFPHFMLKEIHEQPRALNEALVSRTTLGTFPLEGDAFTLEDIAAFDEVTFIACGSSYNAALAASHLFEQKAGMPTRVTLASEYEPLEALRGRSIVVAVTQSGETHDTLNALRRAQEAGFTTLAVTNVVGSTVTREADAWVPIRAGPEISVAATKSFTSQLVLLHALALHLAAKREATPRSVLEDEMEALRDVSTHARALLDDADAYEKAGAKLARHDRSFVLGRGQGHAMALETALKIKEISYIHAEGIAAGELKHGPLALIEDGTPVLALAPQGPLLDAMTANMEEVAARGGDITVVTDAHAAMKDAGFDPLIAPSDHPATFPYAATIAGQLIAYHAAVERGTNVDKPRNLAKSVTVE